jgi:hypothetical protein
MGEPFVDGPISPSVCRMFADELLGDLKGAGDMHEGSGISKLGSHFAEGFFGISTRGRDLVKVFRRTLKRTIDSLTAGTSVLTRELLQVCRTAFRGLNASLSSPIVFL